MKILIQIFAFCFLAGSFQSCVNEYVPDTSGQDQSFAIYGEFESGAFRPSIRVGSTFDASTEMMTFDQRLFVDIYEEDVLLAQFRPSQEDPLYWVAPSQFNLKEGMSYRLEIDGNAFDLPFVQAQSAVPEAAKIDDAQIGEISINTVGMTFETSIPLELDINNSSSENVYYVLEAYIINNDNDEVYADFNVPQNALNAFKTLSHRHGILIDYNTLESPETISVDLSFDGNIDPTSLNDTQLYLKLKTVQEEYYKYHTAISQQNNNDLGPFALPVITYSNISNGFGLFTTFSADEKSVDLN